ncbi:MAG: dihydrodipicolinate reductase C-terminal domain-containing protein [Terriglobales bacterium]|jgi:4-hydroxy-tetrahydrodipicolinate reductase
MNILVLGRGKTGSLVAEVARERRHHVDVLNASDNPKASALTAEKLVPINMVIDFTAPNAVLENVEACIRAKKSIVVGTTGWYAELPRIRPMVEDPGCGIGLLYAANFSVGVNLFFEVARSAAAALQHQYFGQIFERHHAQKKDAPSGTAMALQKVVQESAGTELEITSFREGDVVGMHELVLDSPADTIYLCHTAKSRRGFAEGAVRAAEWLVGKKGIFDFKDVWREL